MSVPASLLPPDHLNTNTNTLDTILYYHPQQVEILTDNALPNQSLSKHLFVQRTDIVNTVYLSCTYIVVFYIIRLL